MRHHAKVRSSARQTVRVLLPLLLGAPALPAQIYIGQSFAAPTTGSTLLQQLVVGATGHTGSAGTTAYTASIFAYNGSALVGSSLFSQSLGTSFSGYTLSPNLTLISGGTYAVVVANTAGGSQSTIATDLYADGTAITCLSPTSCSPRAGTNDLLGFSLQFGGAAVTTPEPTSIALVGAGVLGLLGVARRRRTP